MGKKRETYYYKDRNSKECFKYLALFGIWYVITLLIIIKFLSEVMAPTPEFINVFRFFFAVGIIFSAWSGYKYLSKGRTHKSYYGSLRSKKVKYLVVGIILASIILAASAYSDIPQLEPIRKQIESFKSGIGGSELLVGQTGERDGIAITVRELRLANGYYSSWSPEWHGPGVHEISGGKIARPTKGAIFLFVYIKVENVGKTKKSFPEWHPNGPELYDDISLYYAGASMDKLTMHEWSHPTYGKYPQLLDTEPLTPLYCCVCPSLVYVKEWTCERYPDETVEGWIGFEVPEGIGDGPEELCKIRLEVNGLVWRFWDDPESTIMIVPG